MANRTDLEEMGRELQCPLCLSLMNSPASLPCSHVFCNFCIVNFLELYSDCPVCKIPFFPRDVRPSPRLLNLVNIYKGMERSSGMNLFLTQNLHYSKFSDEETKCQVDADCGQEGSESQPATSTAVETSSSKPITRPRGRPPIRQGYAGCGRPRRWPR